MYMHVNLCVYTLCENVTFVYVYACLFVCMCEWISVCSVVGWQIYVI